MLKISIVLLVIFLLAALLVRHVRASKRKDVAGYGRPDEFDPPRPGAPR